MQGIKTKNIKNQSWKENSRESSQQVILNQQQLLPIIRFVDKSDYS